MHQAAIKAYLLKKSKCKSVLGHLVFLNCIHIEISLIQYELEKVTNTTVKRTKKTVFQMTQ